MKIMHVIDGLGRGGAETLLINTILLLPNDEHIVICLSAQYDFDVEHKKLFTHYVFSLKNKLHIPSIIFSVQKLIKKYKPDIVHAHLIMSGLIAKLATPKNIPLFYSIHSNYSFSYFKRSWFIKSLENFTAKPYHHLIGVTGVVLDDYRKNISNAGSGDVLYNFVAQHFFNINCPSTYKPGSPLRCIAVGNLRHEKNYEYILAQFKLIKKYPVQLDIYGEGIYKERLTTYKTDNDLVHVELKGKADNISELMPAYDLFICCSISEGFGIAPLEAMAAKLPVVISSIPVFKEIIGNCGFVVKLESDKSDESLSAILENIYHGNLNLQSKVEEAFTRATQIASQQNYISQLKNIYQKYNR